MGRNVYIGHVGACNACDDAGEVTRHHVFGRGVPILMHLCHACHTQYHKELETTKAGPLVRRVLNVVVRDWARCPQATR